MEDLCRTKSDLKKTKIFSCKRWSRKKKEIFLNQTENSHSTLSHYEIDKKRNISINAQPELYLHSITMTEGNSYVQDP